MADLNPYEIVTRLKQFSDSSHAPYDGLEVILKILKNQQHPTNQVRNMLDIIFDIRQSEYVIHQHTSDFSKEFLQYGKYGTGYEEIIKKIAREIIVIKLSIKKYYKALVLFDFKNIIAPTDADYTYKISRIYFRIAVDSCNDRITRIASFIDIISEGLPPLPNPGRGMPSQAQPRNPHTTYDFDLGV